MSTYISQRYGPNANRNWWGIAHRRWLIGSGQYIKTSNPNPKWIVGEPGPELVKLHKGNK